jgi:hypothetical protein
MRDKIREVEELKFMRDEIREAEELNLCYALLRMRPLLNSWAECSVVISCGNVDYDKSG